MTQTEMFKTYVVEIYEMVETGPTVQKVLLDVYDCTAVDMEDVRRQLSNHRPLRPGVDLVVCREVLG